MPVLSLSPSTNFTRGLLGCLLLGGAIVPHAGANDVDEIQRRDLALIQTQIEQIKVVVERIDARQHAAEPSATRLFFDIPRLRTDLDAISQGIDHYLAPGRWQPRIQVPINGDYIDDRVR